MATKKDKRERALAKREAFLAEEKQRGLAAQAQSRKQERDRLDKLAAAARRENQILENRLAVLKFVDALAVS